MVMLSDFKHLRDVCMSYSEHMRHSHRLGVLFIKAGLKAFIHGIWPAAFVTSSSDTIELAGELMNGAGCREIENVNENANENAIENVNKNANANSMNLIIPEVNDIEVLFGNVFAPAFGPIFGPLASPTIRSVILDRDGNVIDRGLNMIETCL